MTWEPIIGKSKQAELPVTMASSAGSGHLPPLLTITLRFAYLPPLPFLSETGTCTVLFGAGEHAGLLRLVPGTDAVLFSPGRKNSASACLRFAAPKGVPRLKRAPVAVEFSVQPDLLELRLPAWAIVPARQPAPEPAPSGHRSIMERVPDPATALRGRNGR